MKAPVLHFPFSSIDGTHTCRLEYDWLGTERYYIDDLLVHRQWSLLKSTAAFSSHGVEIEIQNKVVARWPVTEVRINGELKIPNLMKECNQVYKEGLDRFFGPKPTLLSWLTKTILWCVLAFLLSSAYFWLAKHAA